MAMLFSGPIRMGMLEVAALAYTAFGDHCGALRVARRSLRAFRLREGRGVAAEKLEARVDEGLAVMHQRLRRTAAPTARSFLSAP